MRTRDGINRLWAVMCLTLGLSMLAGGCTPTPDVRFFQAGQHPDRLSAWGLMTLHGNKLVLATTTDAYELNTALFSDYALKLRTLYLPGQQAMRFKASHSFTFPDGTIISKTFFYHTNKSGELRLGTTFNGNPGQLDLTTTRLLETRLLVKEQGVWHALPYVWSGDDAYLRITGDLLQLPVADNDPLNYLVPSKNQCQSCHATDHTRGANKPIGLKARHLNRTHPVHNANQLVYWSRQGKLSGLPSTTAIPAAASWPVDEQFTALTKTGLNHLARTYLDINCGHCHNPNGSADTSGLLLNYDNRNMAALGVCKPPIAAGRGSGGHLFSIVPGQPESSILLFRMRSGDPAAMMPELGRSLPHREGIHLIRAWIKNLSGSC